MFSALKISPSIKKSAQLTKGALTSAQGFGMPEACNKMTPRYVEQGNNDNYTLEELKPHPDPIKVLVKILILLGHTTGCDSYFKQTGLFYDRSKSGVEINKKDFRRSP